MPLTCRRGLERGDAPAGFVFLGLGDAAFAFVLAQLMLALLLIGLEHPAQEPRPVIVFVHDGSSVVVVPVQDDSGVVVVLGLFNTVLGDDVECLSIGIRILSITIHDRRGQILVILVIGVRGVLRIGLLRLPFLPVLGGIVELVLTDGEAGCLTHLHPIRILSRRLSDDSHSQSASSRTGDADANQSCLDLVVAGGVRRGRTDRCRSWCGQTRCLVEAAG